MFEIIMEYLTPTLIGIVLIALGIFTFILMRVNKKAKNTSNKIACRKIYTEKLIRNWTDFFWSNSMRFAWITLFLVTIIIYGYVAYAYFHIFTGAIISIFFSIITLMFFYFAWHSYHNFEEKAKKRLTDFENAIKAGIDKEISFEGDNIQSYSKSDDNMDTNEKTFYFSVPLARIPFPPFQKNKAKQLVSEQKIDALILSREYFSICKSATPFNLLNPKEGAMAKKCAEVKASGECDEHYYSQMQNVEYDSKEECIRIIYYGDIPDAIFKCKKAAANRKPAMKALKEKLRITERQRLSKIDEHKKFKDIKEESEVSSKDDEE